MRTEKLTDILKDNYIPYASYVVLHRAIPKIDGLKPSQRKLLYTMYEMGLLRGSKTKSANIVGQTMKLHPHGDSSIYETMINMVGSNERLNYPLIEGKGNFGKVYSSELKPAAQRYTEAKLGDICVELFEGMNENAVAMRDSYDGKQKEPEILPTKFPNILVNASEGMAVGLSCKIPSFTLQGVCEATIGVVQGKIKDSKTLMEILGTPEYTTGGIFHADKESLERLGETGAGTFTVSCKSTLKKDRIEINELPAGVKVETILSAVEDLVKKGKITEINGINDKMDLKGFQLDFTLKRGSSPEKVMDKLLKYTKLRSTVSYNTLIILDGKPKKMGLKELLESWVTFRLVTLTRIYNHRVQKYHEQEQRLMAWEKIKSNIKRAVEIITTSSVETEAKVKLMEEFGMNEEQAEVLLDTKLRDYTEDNLQKKLKMLEAVRENKAESEKMADSEEEQRKQIVRELKEIKKKYAKKSKTEQAGEAEKIEIQAEEKTIDSKKVMVCMNEGGYIRKISQRKDIGVQKQQERETGEVYWEVPNDSYMLVFTTKGELHKIQVNDIEGAREYKDEIYKLCRLENKDEVLYVDMARDFSGGVTFIERDGKATKRGYGRFNNRKMKFTGIYPEVENKDELIITNSERYFVKTDKERYAYRDTTDLAKGTSGRATFRVCKTGKAERVVEVYPVDEHKDTHREETREWVYEMPIGEELEKYTKGTPITDEPKKQVNPKWQVEEAESEESVGEEETEENRAEAEIEEAETEEK